MLLPVGGEELLPDLDTDVTCLPSLVESQQVSPEPRGWLQDHCVCRREEEKEKQGEQKGGIEKGESEKEAEKDTETMRRQLKVKCIVLLHIS